MLFSFRIATACLVLTALSFCGGSFCQAEPPDPAAVEHFEKHIRPLLANKCFECHGHKKQQADLRLDSRETMLKGNENGPVLVPNNAADSRLIQVLLYHEDDVQMPPADKLPESEISLLTAWVTAGAIFPKSDTPTSTDPEAWRQHWSFQPVASVEVPAQKNDNWSRTDIDRFVVQRLSENNLSPAVIASPRTQLRRLYYDLIGLPPTFAQFTRFEEKPTDTEFAAITNELLNAQQFGERWGRYWLDIARYSDTRGYIFTQEREYKEAYLYRNWVMDSLNDDMPYDQFLIHQLAADVLAPDDANQLAAMGYLTLGRRFLGNKHDIIDDRIDVVTRGMMGLTVTCARCHDHKYDPIPTADYYSLYGVFASSEEPNNAPSTLRLVDRKTPHEPVIFRRGNPFSHGDRVTRHFLTALSTNKPQPFKNGSGRLELARAIANPDNPLTARVFVNRVWAHLIGHGLVRTHSDFGVRSQPPTHPKLLDKLAYDFVAGGWSVKQLIRNIVASSVYRQASTTTSDILVSDPENRLLSHANRRRLDFESHRDSLLFVSGQLDETFGGKSVKLTDQPSPRRRTCYAYIDRQNLPGVFRAFDFASPDTHSPGRHETTVPQQALYQLNNRFVHEMSTAVGSNGTATTNDVSTRIQSLYHRVYGRNPTADELSIGKAFVQSAVANPVKPTWQYGFGQVDENVAVAGEPQQTTQKVIGFTALQHFTGTAWQAGEKLPDKKHGWVMLSAGGGHPGNLKFMAIRRWVAPATGNLAGVGKLSNETEAGDGVRGRVISNRHGTLGDWTASHESTVTLVKPFEVQAGDTIDFVVDCRTTEDSDSFGWNLQLRMTNSDSKQRSWNSAKDFAGTQLGIWDQYAQALLLSNEFVFVD